MWNAGKHWLWQHISQVYFMDVEKWFEVTPKIAYGQTKLAPYSVMCVHLAAQVLSSTMSNVLSHYGGDEVAGASTFCEMFDILLTIQM